MFYIYNNKEVVEVEVLSKNTVDYHNDTFTYYSIKFRNIVKIEVSSNRLYDSKSKARDALVNITRTRLTSLKGQVEELETRLKFLG